LKLKEWKPQEKEEWKKVKEGTYSSVQQRIRGFGPRKRFSPDKQLRVLCSYSSVTLLKSWLTKELSESQLITQL
jgi:hypothetical protein